MLSLRSIETLVDLVEIKLSYMQVSDREDQREELNLKRALNELMLLGRGDEADLGGMAGAHKRGRRPKMLRDTSEAMQIAV